MKRLLILVLSLCLLLIGCQDTNFTSKKEIKNQTQVETEVEKTNQEENFRQEKLRSFYSLAIDDFTPNKLSNYETASILRNIHQGLYKIDSKGDLVLGLADSIEVEEVEGYLMYDIVLKEDIKFHNGSPIRPEDVQYSFFRYAGLIPQVNNSKLENFKYWVNLLDGAPGSVFKKGRVETLGSNRIILFVDNFYGQETTSSLLASTYIIPQNYSEEDQSKHPIGAGPYKFDSIDENGKIELSFFEAYYGPKPYIRQLSLIKSADKVQRSQSFLDGDLDMVDSYPGQSLEPGSSPLSGDLYSLVYNVDDPIMKDLDLRKAINALINKEDILKQLFGQVGAIAQSPLSPYHYKNLPDLSLPKSFDPQKATEILQARPELLDNKLTISYGQEDFLAGAIAELIQAYMETYGFKVDLDPLPYQDFIQRTSSQPDKDYQMAIFRYSGDIDPVKIFDRFTTRAGKNISNFYSLDYNELTKKGLASINQMMEMLRESCPETYLLDPGQSYKMAEDLRQPAVYPYPYLDFSSIEGK
ncbi:MAG: ABC transporter substrate-binding protein [Bacillota bacterium]|nr:ABC transporter substrate-binding protein [Bacillota bacterium]